jgi:hypothetical protein
MAAYGEEVVSKIFQGFNAPIWPWIRPRASRGHAAISPDISLAGQFPISDWKIGNSPISDWKIFNQRG